MRGITGLGEVRKAMLLKEEVMYLRCLSPLIYLNE